LNNRCIVCESTGAEPHYPGIVRCTDCGYVYANLDLTQAQFEALYSDGYFAGEEYSDYAADKAVHQRNFISRLDTLARFVDPMSHRRLLEVGCAYGFFLELASQRFDESVGIDVTAAGVGHARDTLGLNAVRRDLLDWDFGNAPVDVVCMWDTIEHLQAPDRYLERIASNMTTGGLLALTTGDIDSKVARWRGEKWRLIHPPTHAHYFSQSSLTRLLDRYGFDVVHAEHCGFYRSVGNVAHNLLVLRWRVPAVYALLNRLGISKWMFYSNMFDIVYLIARRR
jgi:cyclopropane fatty-acyl-phospholipid synthase-like methyltransferase